MLKQISLKQSITQLLNQGAINVCGVWNTEDLKGRAKKGAILVAIAAIFDVGDQVNVPDIQGANVKDLVRDFPRVVAQGGHLEVRVIAAALAAHEKPFEKDAINRVLFECPLSWRGQAERKEQRRKSLLTAEAALNACKNSDGYVCSATRRSKNGVVEFGALFRETAKSIKLPKVEGLIVSRESVAWQPNVFGGDGREDKPHRGFMIIGSATDLQSVSMNAYFLEYIEKMQHHNDL